MDSNSHPANFCGGLHNCYQYLAVNQSFNMSSNNTTDECVGLLLEDGKYPTASEFYEGLRGYAIGLYVASAVVVGVLLVQYLILVVHFWKYVPGSRRAPTLWVSFRYFWIASLYLFNLIRFLFHSHLNSAKNI